MEGEIAWLVGRELLMEGMDHLAGQGDVCVWPAEDGTHVYIRLQAPGGRQLLRAPSEALDDFLWRSLALLPLGSEGTWLDVDGLVEACLELH